MSKKSSVRGDVKIDYMFNLFRFVTYHGCYSNRQYILDKRFNKAYRP